MNSLTEIDASIRWTLEKQVISDALTCLVLSAILFAAFCVVSWFMWKAWKEKIKSDYSKEDIFFDMLPFSIVSISLSAMSLACAFAFMYRIFNPSYYVLSMYMNMFR